ncbi:MAG TPA: glycosyltransferase, partial [Candidatus Babeliales bacterium]|nr:glycosyltransferase [Candidatus Babeliales bacterium]
MKFSNILFINGRLPIPLNVGGDGHSMDALLQTFSKRGIKVESHNIINPHFKPNKIEDVEQILITKKIIFLFDGKNRVFRYSRGYPITIHNALNINEFLDRYIKQHEKTVVFTQLDLAREVLDFTLLSKVPTVLFLRDTFRNNLLTLGKIKKKNNLIHIVFNSSFTRERFKDIERFVSTSIIYPPINIKKYELKKHNPKYITIINPVKEKGGRIFLKIAKNSPKHQFLAVKGWYDPIGDGIDLTKLNNVTVWERQDDITKAYEVTKLLLIPSQSNEGFGRVAAESLIAKIPVLASNNAGLKDALGDVGYYVNKYESPSEWIKS